MKGRAKKAYEVTMCEEMASIQPSKVTFGHFWSPLGGKLLNGLFFSFCPWKVPSFSIRYHHGLFCLRMVSLATFLESAMLQLELAELHMAKWLKS